VYRGLLFSAFYGAAAAASFPLSGKVDRAGILVGTLGSCIVFAVGHEQYGMALRVVVGVVAVVFANPWITSSGIRSSNSDGAPADDGHTVAA